MKLNFLLTLCSLALAAISLVMAAPVDSSRNHSVLHKRGVTRYDEQVYTAPSGKVYSLYHTNWATYGRNYQVSDLPIDQLTDITYAFVKLTQSGDSWSISSTDSYSDYDKNFQGWGPENTLPFNGNLGEFYSLKQKGKKFNLILSVGGWTLSNTFSNAVSTATGRATLAASIVEFFNTYPIFVGVSIDWEYLSDDGVNYGNGGNAASTGDVLNFKAFLKILRTAFSQNGMGHYKIAFCAVAATNKAKFDIGGVGELIDELHLMTYDFASSSWGDTVTTHHANLYPASYTTYSVSQAVDYYIANGMPASKIMIGAAFYSRGFANTLGLGQSGSGTVSVMSWEQGVADYKSLPRSGFTEYWDDTCKATYMYNSATKEFVSYDSVASIQAKCDYVKSKGLKGIIAWESAGDFAVTNSRSLNAVIHRNFGSPADSPVSTAKDTATTTGVTSTATVRSSTVTAGTKSTSTTTTGARTTSTATATPTGGATTWSAGKYYTVGSAVVYNGVDYVCLQAHTSLVGWEPATTPSLWAVFKVASSTASRVTTTVAPTTSKVVSSTTTSTPRVTTVKTSTASTTTTTAPIKTLSTSSATPTSSADVDQWKANQIYGVGAKVSYNSVVYTCLQAHTSLVGWEPSSTPALWTRSSGSTVASTATVQPAAPSTSPPSKTETLAPTSASAPAWTANKSYTVGDLVTYNRATYRCVQSHKSLTTWEPSNAPALWSLVN